MSQPIMNERDQYIMTEWNLHDNFVRSLLKTLDASPDNETMEHQQLGTRLTYATLELQFSDMLFKWLEGFMNRLRESIAVLEGPIMAPEECNVGPIVAKACESRKFLEDVQILGQRHSVNYMSLWIHKKRIVAEFEERLQNPKERREIDNMYKELRNLELEGSTSNIPDILVQKFLRG